MKEIRTYIDNMGRKVSALLDVNSETLNVSPKSAIFKGSFQVETNLGVMPMGFNFPEKYTLKKCFEDFDTLAQKAIEDKQKEMLEKNIIATPNNGAGNIIIPGH